MPVLTAALVGARAVPRSILAVAALAVVPAMVVAARGGDDFAGALAAASVIAGAGVGYSIDDAAAPTLAASPTTLAVRRGLRAIVVATVLGVAWLAAVVIAHLSTPRPAALRDLVVELAATAAVAAAVASRARTDVPVASGAAAAGVSVLIILTISAFAYRWPALPTLGGGAVHDRWWWVAGAGLAVAAWSSRDPAARIRFRPKAPAIGRFGRVDGRG